MEYDYTTTSLLSVKENIISQETGYLVGTLFLSAQKNIMNAPYYGIEYDKNAINLQKINLCKKATNGCAISCIYHQGILKNSDFSKHRIKQARIKRTLRFLIQREDFFAQLIKEIKALVRKATRKNLIPTIQLNGTSDILWEKEKFVYEEKEYKNLMELFYEINFFDYTKFDILKSRKKLPNNYYLTYSRAGKHKGTLVDPWESLKNYLDNQIDVAIIFTKEMKNYILAKRTYNEYKIIDGDLYNCRTYDRVQREDERGLIVALTAAAKTDINSSCFIIQTKEEVNSFLN